MSSRTLTIAGFVVLFVAAGVLLVVSKLRPDRVARFSDALAHVTAPGKVRVLVLFAWAWLGWHFLAR
ncbi:MAG TPA: DUF6186 family protein [Actinopolymorphaceae bacterium]|nr:DUF6186 family protein [Actinopolymorphaceae bacterium]